MNYFECTDRAVLVRKFNLQMEQYLEMNCINDKKIIAMRDHMLKYLDWSKPIIRERYAFEFWLYIVVADRDSYEYPDCDYLGKTITIFAPLVCSEMVPTGKIPSLARKKKYAHLMNIVLKKLKTLNYNAESKSGESGVLPSNASNASNGLSAAGIPAILSAANATDGLPNDATQKG